MADDDLNPASNLKPDDYRQAFQSREIYTKHTDPCAEASKATMKCLDRNNYDKTKCTEFFQAYTECKKTSRSGSGTGGRAYTPESIAHNIDTCSFAALFTCTFSRSAPTLFDELLPPLLSPLLPRTAPSLSL
ncbi:hypothetical protein FIBSPDRAFT_11293 [Athelia psychrophila]|uniref:CHCH domain-containing protein n=1 Tax=Athelia psychrophila TaxID=1759441 RepID=A0A166XA85_9AGAM|nr:hypothetical protein FIBSPDRAFT_11293 [Fibularhizoctonia sp. CBS 109695]